MEHSDLKKIYSGKRVFLTGHTGFKGTWMLFYLEKLGCEVMGFSNQTNELYDKINDSYLGESVIGDVRDKDYLKQTIVEFNPDFIFHFAAQPLVRDSYENPIETFETNILGTANLLDACKFIDKKCSIVIITTDKVYENKEWIYPYRENDKLGGYDPYSASKGASELVINSYRASFFNLNYISSHGKAIATARAGNVIGGGDYASNRIIPDLIRAYSCEEELIIRSPNSIRPWQHVLDPLNGYLILGALLNNNSSKFSGAWNFAPLSNEELKVIDVVELATASWGNGSFRIANLDNGMHEAGILKLDISKSLHYLNWRPKLSSVNAIKLTIEWYKNELNGNLAEDLIKENLNYYINL
jgi:CDP-glucose 4,6-dehydratase